MARIEMQTPLVEMDGDEMTRVLWPMVKEKLLAPHVDLKVQYYDLGLQNRDETEDRITVEAALAIQKYGVGVKCATITPNADRMSEYGLKQLWKSPNGTIRAILDGTVFRKPILVRNIAPAVSGWTRPIIVGRHAYGDVYKNCEIRTSGPGKAELVFTADDGTETRRTIMEMKAPGILQGIHNTTASIENFARACCGYALDQKVDLWFGAKDTISKIYDGTFKEVFSRVFATEFKTRFDAAGLVYAYSLIDDVVARIMRSDGGMLWACKNYDGDVMSDMVASAFGSLAMMTSVLVSPDGCFEYEAAHGTVQRHYYRHLKGEKVSTNAVALIFAWTGALRRRGRRDAIASLGVFADTLERTVIETIQAGDMTGDLAARATPPARRILDAEAFLEVVAENLHRNWGRP